MVDHLLLATRMSARAIVSLVMETHLSSFESMQSKRRSPKAHHTVGPPLPERPLRGRSASSARPLRGRVATYQGRVRKT